MTLTTVPASQGSATFSDLNVTINLTVADTLVGDIVQILNDETDVVLGTATKTVGTSNWTASISLPANTTTINVSARTKRGVVYSAKSSPAFVITYAALAP